MWEFRTRENGCEAEVTRTWQTGTKKRVSRGAAAASAGQARGGGKGAETEEACRRKNTKREGARGPEHQRGHVRGLAEARETEERRRLEKEIVRGAQGQREVGAEDRDIDTRPGSSGAADDRQRREGGERS